MSDRLTYAVMGAVAAVCLGGGVALGWAIWGRPVPSPDKPAPEQRQPDNSLVLRREPESGPIPAPHVIPKGSSEERRVSVTLQPYDTACPPVRVTLSVVRSMEGGARVIASSPDGRVTGGVDVPMPIPAALAAEVRPWAAGVSYAGQDAWGVFVHRDVWRLRLGVEVNAPRAGGSEARATVGWTW